MKNIEKPFQLHMKAIIFSESKNLRILINNPDDILLPDSVLSIGKFAFDQDFCDFGSTNIPLFSIQQNLSPILKESDDILNAYNDNFFNNNGLVEFSKKYPLIYTLSKEILNQTTNFYKEIYQHIDLDRDILSKQFNSSRPLGHVKSIEINQGDVHNEGKSTAIIKFNSGLKIVYKPRSGSMDIAFNALLDHLSIEIGIQFKTAITLDKGEYFWMEFIEHIPVSHKKELSEYYVTSGALLAVCYLLNGTDFHHENIIAHGKYPVLIDLECLFGATDEMGDGTYSVYNTGLVPLNVYEGEKSEPIDSSGFGASGKQISALEAWKWEDINTDAVRLTKSQGVFIADTNQPEYNGQKISPEQYQKQFIQGFETVCKWFIAHQDDLDKANFIMNHFKDKPFRVVIRNTVDYRSILDNSLVAKALISDKERKNEIYDSLNEFQPFIYLNSKIKSKVLAKEFDAIKRMNIPLFTGNTSETLLFESNHLVSNEFFKVVPYQFIIDKIKRLTTNDIKSQINLIHSAFILRYKQNTDSYFHKKRISKPIENIEYNDEVLTNEVKRIASQIRKSAIKNKTSYLWNCYTSSSNKKLFYNTLGTGFYEGNLGMSYFFNLFGKLTDDRQFEKDGIQIIESEIKRSLSENYNVDISMATGLAGLIYSLLKLPKNKGIQLALPIIALIEREDIINDKKYDIMSGTAGLLLVLSSLYKTTQSKEVLDLMILIGDHLVKESIIDPSSGFRTWQSELFNKPMTGFSHGVSGIGCALLALYECTENEEYKNLFYEALAFENFHKNNTLSNWQDLRENNGSCKTAWCHGAPGIGLARLYAYKILKDPCLLEDIERAIVGTKNDLQNETDFYCCGNTGKIDFLIEASRILDRPELLMKARQSIMRILYKKNERGYYTTYEIPEISLENPSLFRGTAGIGYTLLRCMESSEIGCMGLLQ
ncbi:type 2 lanthipeptide synthetase LanM [Flavobacterium sp. '19STA2R22 D10 B1']|uniref:type 2 lanthipeptide synthetase LanM n=1 Tax=Flavobacterium aerium TaxID=3037261 RepID=UPI00278C72F4|nr:type 2 lanthipeptide synthetase LanM [Flavobacterium sp. '19STA2R22 D10 B1']